MATVTKPVGVIVAEPDPVVRAILRTRLEAMHHAVFPANDGLEAVTLASRVQASLVILDIKISELDGVRACSRIRQLPGYANTPILMLTFNDSERIQAIASKVGATMFLAKPLDEATLGRILAKYLPASNPEVDKLRAEAVQPGVPLLATRSRRLSDASPAEVTNSPWMEEIPGLIAQPGGVIVADDDPLIRDLLKAKLESLDQEVSLAHTGLEAVTLASQIRASLIILDIGMPKMDGVVACAHIRALPGHALTPIVMLTFNDTPTAKAAASRAGATMFLVKPFGQAALMLALARFLPIDDERLRTIHADAVRAAGGRAFNRPHT